MSKKHDRRQRQFKWLMRLINWYPPYVGAGIHMYAYRPDYTRFEVRMKLRWYNRNLIGTHFGGSLYSMCDPFYVFILLANLGTDYIVWDQAASIRFKRPGKTTVTAVFEISTERISEIRTDVDANGKGSYTFHTQVFDTSGVVVAEVEKQVYVRRKPPDPR